MQLKNFLSMKETVKRMRQAVDGEKIFTKDPSDKGLLFKI